MTSISVAIVGYAARLPGAESVADVWEVLSNGVCTIGSVGNDRFTVDRFFDPRPGALGKSFTFRAGILENIFDFDAEDFGISPLEATQMDPQQRLLLESVAHAFDHAGIDPHTLKGGRTGVFVGASSADHSIAALQDPRMIEGHFMLGNTLSIFSNRVSHQWDFRGPSQTIDTACSSGLFAFHQGVKEIEAGTIDTAVVSGVNLLLSPMPFIGFSHARMLSPDGLCRPFSAEANGYVRAEGVVTFILRREDTAKEDGDRILSRVRGSLTSNDGAKSGITIPSAIRQSELLTRTLLDSGLTAEHITFVEAHGTGTAVGDPIEAHAIGNSYGQFRGDVLPIGSAKGNFGHLEPVSGLVGLLKAQLALEHRALPATLHATALNPRIDFEALNLEVVREPTALPKTGEAIAAVSSFGFGGANAHALLSHFATATPENIQIPEKNPAIRLSASNAQSLKDLAVHWSDKLTGNGDTGVSDANHRTKRRAFQLGVPPGEPTFQAQALRDWIAKKPTSAVEARSGERDAKVAFVFAGNGSLWPGMGQAMYANDATFRRSIKRSSKLFTASGGIDVEQYLLAEDIEERLGVAEVDQPLLFSLQIALAAALKTQGLVPDAVLGHSVGEVSAAVVSGAISAETGVRIILSRSRLLEVLRGTGTMAAVNASESDVSELLGEFSNSVEIGAVNARTGVTVSGPPEDVETVLRHLRKKRIAGRKLKVDYPYHSSALELLKTELRDDLADIPSQKPKKAFYSTCEGSLFAKPLKAEYWWNNARKPVRFADAMESLCEDGHTVFVEISPQPVLQAYVRDAIDGTGTRGASLPGLVQDNSRDACTIALDALVHGATSGETVLLGEPGPSRGPLPLYPFDRKTYRLEYKDLSVLGPNEARHPLLGDRVVSGGNEWRNDISVSSLPWLADHKVQDRTVLPATAIVEILSEAARQALQSEKVALSNIELLRPVFLPADTTVRIRVVFDETLRKLTFAVRGQDAWMTSTTARASEFHGESDSRILLDWGDKPSALYKALSEAGLVYGETFRRVQSFAASSERLDVRLTPADVRSIYRFDPISADASLHALGHLISDPLRGEAMVLLPARIDTWNQYTSEPIAGARIDAIDSSGSRLQADVTYVDTQGGIVAKLLALQLRPARVTNDAVLRFWHEELDLVARAEAPQVDAMLKRKTEKPSQEDSDLDVLRSALGHRLAWDARASDDEERAKVAQDTVAAGLGADFDIGSPDCPWPELNDLVELLIEAFPSASDELHSVLNASSQSDSSPYPSNRAIEAACRLCTFANLQDLRVALSGQINLSLAKALTGQVGALTVLADDASAVEALGLQFEDGLRPKIELATNEDLRSAFDLVIVLGSNVANPAVLLQMLASGGALIVFAENPDELTTMTVPSASVPSLEALKRRFQSKSAKVDVRQVKEFPSLRALLVSAKDQLEDTIPFLQVNGDGPLADALRTVSSGDTDSPIVKVLELEDDTSAFNASLHSRFFNQKNDGQPLWIVTQGVHSAPVLQGWRRAAANEADIDIRTAVVDADTDPVFVAHVLAISDEQELIFENGLARAPRVRRTELNSGGGSVLQLEKTGPENGGGVSWRSSQRRAPIGDEIEVRIEACGLNFRDVMWANDLLPYDAVRTGFVGPALGMECAGKVIRSGPDSTIKTGARVALLAPGALATHVTTSENTAIELLDSIDTASAAALPVAFSTALYALETLANLKAGESVLIHAATGGVGLAAVQIAKNIGARVLATAGSSEKRKLLTLLGVDSVFDSRSLNFSEAVRDATGGAGVDVVLNSLAGEAMEASVHCLAPFGRFLELGKRDYFADTPLPLRVFRNNISYFGVDLDQLLKCQPAVATRLFERLNELLRSDVITPQPFQQFNSNRVEEAFETLKKAEHIGKVIISPPEPRTPKTTHAATQVRGTWLITGGTSGFGLETARWLANRGVERLWLVSRSGTIEAEAEKALKQLVDVQVRSCDVADTSQVQALIDEIELVDGQLNGVVHAAMVLRDMPYKDLSKEDINAVVRPKIDGAMNLDKCTESHDLDHFWLYSSVAARFGSVGQAPYVAANSALEQLAARRVSNGRTALAIAWGPIFDVGYLARETNVRKTVKRQFGGSLRAAAALAKLGTFLDSGDPRSAITIATSPRPALSLRTTAGPLMSAFGRESTDFGERLLEAVVAKIQDGQENKATELVVDLMTTEAARITRAPRNTIDVNRPLNEIGFDSLMGVNLLLEIEQKLGNSAAMLDGSIDLSIQKLARRVVQTLKSEGDGITSNMAARHLSSTELSKDAVDEITRLADKLGEP